MGAKKKSCIWFWHFYCLQEPFDPVLHFFPLIHVVDERFALENIVPVTLAPVKFALLKSALLKSALLKLVPDKLEVQRDEPVKLAPERFALDKLAPFIIR
ncbi:MAG: hypothetical protein BWX92_01032 [Deltaproteobacteria bacterium ADurb.Bin135]|nr:MAG: hypothetical protein BWX92_01032 [Deltaproteobacteria bacterium ADurb.Bin135]